MEKKLQALTIPNGFRIVKNAFYTYDPEKEYNQKDHLIYLTEDLFQAVYESTNLLVDLGWYGDTSQRAGAFKIMVLNNQDWDNPLFEGSAKSSAEIKNMLNDVLGMVAKGKSFIS